jgi:nucleoside-diphosphate-sugar epimerase
MKVLVAGADGAIGVPLTRLLLARGHQVLGLIRDPAGVTSLRAFGVEPIVADALDRERLLSAVKPFRADAIVHELTALRKPPLRPSGMVMTNRLRTLGTDNLLAAATVMGACRMVTQSIFLGYGCRDHGDHLITEDDPFGTPAGDLLDPTILALNLAELKTFTIDEGITLRYGFFYGGDVRQIRPMLAKRGVPVMAGGLLGWVHHLDAAAATVAALERGRPGQAYNIVDDQPATWREVITTMAEGFGAPSPRQVPQWLLRLVAPYLAKVAVDTSMRVSNEKAKQELGWQPRFRNYHEGIAVMVSGRSEDASVLRLLSHGAH